MTDMHGVIYCRVSTKEQTLNLSLPTQLRACRDHCERNNVRVAAEFIEEGESAKTADRPQLKQLLEYCRKNRGRVDWVVIYSVSRLAREKSDHYTIRLYPYYACRECGRTRARKADLERLFAERLAVLQPQPDYMRLFSAVVIDAWRSQQRDAERELARLGARQETIKRQLMQLDQAFIWEKRIDNTTYEQQRDRLREEATLTTLQHHDAQLDGLDVETLLAYAEHVIGDAARLWQDADSTEKRRSCCSPRESVSETARLEPP